jgi:hypothetical protein
MACRAMSSGMPLATSASTIDRSVARSSLFSAIQRSQESLTVVAVVNCESVISVLLCQVDPR